MTQIYNMTERVCIWLGAGDKRSNSAMGFISDILKLEKISKHHEQWDLCFSLEWSSRFNEEQLVLASLGDTRFGPSKRCYSSLRQRGGQPGMTLKMLSASLLCSSIPYENFSNAQKNSRLTTMLLSSGLGLALHPDDMTQFDISTNETREIFTVEL